MPPAARLTDMHTCPMVPVPGPHLDGPIMPPCMVTVLIGGLPAARVTDQVLCPVTAPAPDVIVKGSLTAVIATGWPTVIIGDSASAGGAPGVAGPGASAGSSLLANAEAFSAETQANTLKQAASDGTPFCEVCKT